MLESNTIEEIKEIVPDNELIDLHSNDRKKSVAVFKKIQTNLQVTSILENQKNPHENIIYAQLIMSNEKCEALWIDIITDENMTLRQINLIHHTCTVEEINIIPKHILLNKNKKTLTDTLISNFLLVYYEVINNTELVNILQNTFWTDLELIKYNKLFEYLLMSPEKLIYLGSYLGLCNTQFIRSLSEFETIKSNVQIKELLNKTISSNENIIYAQLIMSNEKYEALWENIITNITLKRIHIFTQHLEIKQIKEIPKHILLNETIPIDRIDIFLKMKNKLINNSELLKVIEKTFWIERESNDYNLLFAELLISKEKYQIIWEEYLSSKNITPEKMYIIENNLSIEQIKALWIYISNENMTINKIYFIEHNMSGEEIIDFWPEKLAKIDIEDLQIELYC